MTLIACHCHCRSLEASLWHAVAWSPTALAVSFGARAGIVADDPKKKTGADKHNTLDNEHGDEMIPFLFPEREIRVNV